MDNMEIYNRVRAVPDHAKRAIQAGRLKGKTDINPMWRIKTLTELFGPVGDGWRYTIERMWTEQGNGGEVTANVLINLFVKHNGQETAPIPGIGGSMLIAKEKSGLYTDDEAYKKALTDAISVACKALGVGADVYWDKDSTKYSERPKIPQNPSGITCDACGKTITPIFGKYGDQIPPERLAAISQKKYKMNLCGDCQAKRYAEAKQGKVETNE